MPDSGANEGPIVFEDEGYQFPRPLNTNEFFEFDAVANQKSMAERLAEYEKNLEERRKQLSDLEVKYRMWSFARDVGVDPVRDIQLMWIPEKYSAATYVPDDWVVSTEKVHVYEKSLYSVISYDGTQYPEEVLEEPTVQLSRLLYIRKRGSAVQIKHPLTDQIAIFTATYRKRMAVKIQSRWKEFKASKLNANAELIQRLARGYLVRKEWHAKLEEHHRAILIQKNFRRYQAEQRVKKLKEIRSAQTIQSSWRVHKSKRATENRKKKLAKQTEIRRAVRVNSLDQGIDLKREHFIGYSEQKENTLPNVRRQSTADIGPLPPVQQRRASMQNERLPDGQVFAAKSNLDYWRQSMDGNMKGRDSKRMVDNMLENKFTEDSSQMAGEAPSQQPVQPNRQHTVDPTAMGAFYDSSDVVAADVVNECRKEMKERKVQDMILVGHDPRGDAAAKALFDVARASSGITTVDFRHSKLSDYGLMSVATSLAHLPDLKKLFLGGNHFGKEGVNGLMHGLKQCTGLEKLDLNDCCIKSSGLESLMPSMVYQKELQYLDLRKNKLGYKGLQLFEKYLVEEMVFQRLQVLNLGGNEFRDQGAAVVSRIMMKNMPIRRLYMSGNLISDRGAVSLSEGLRENKTLEVLDLMQNHIGSRGCMALYAVLTATKNTTLRTLDLTRNMIGVVGVQGIASYYNTEPLRSEGMDTIYLNENNLGSNGAEVIGEIMRKNPCIRHLNLSCNQLGPDGARALSEGLGMSDTIESVDVRWNKMGDSGILSMTSVVKLTPKCQIVNINRNDSSVNARSRVKLTCLVKQLEVERGIDRTIKRREILKRATRAIRAPVIVMCTEKSVVQRKRHSFRLWKALTSERIQAKSKMSADELAMQNMLRYSAEEVMDSIPAPLEDSPKLLPNRKLGQRALSSMEAVLNAEEKEEEEQKAAAIIEGELVMRADNLIEVEDGRDPNQVPLADIIESMERKYAALVRLREAEEKERRRKEMIAHMEAESRRLEAERKAREEEKIRKIKEEIERKKQEEEEARKIEKEKERQAAKAKIEEWQAKRSPQKKPSISFENEETKSAVTNEEDPNDGTVEDDGAVDVPLEDGEEKESNAIPQEPDEDRCAEGDEEDVGKDAEGDGNDGITSGQHDDALDEVSPSDAHDDAEETMKEEEQVSPVTVETTAQTQPVEEEASWANIPKSKIAENILGRYLAAYGEWTPEELEAASQILPNDYERGIRGSESTANSEADRWLDRVNDMNQHWLRGEESEVDTDRSENPESKAADAFIGHLQKSPMSSLSQYFPGPRITLKDVYKPDDSFDFGSSSKFEMQPNDNE